MTRLNLKFAWLTISFCLFLVDIHSIAANWLEYGNYDISWYSKDKKEFTINNATELAGLAFIVNNQVADFRGCKLSLENDIDLRWKDWSPIGTNDYPFRGNFDGNGHSIKGVTISKYESDYIGFFGAITGNTIRNFSVEGTIQIRDKGSICSGLVSGWSSSSTVENIHISLNLYCNNVERHDYGGGYLGSWYQGGAVGDSYGSIYESISADVYIEDKIGGKADTDYRQIFMGGIVGRMLRGAINKCTANNNFKSDISQVSSSGLETKVNFGGIVGLVETYWNPNYLPYKITSCFATNIVSGEYWGSLYPGTFNYLSCKFRLGGIVGTTRDNTETKLQDSSTQIECCVAINKKFEIDGTHSNYVSTWSYFGGILGSEAKYQPVIFASNFSNSDCEKVYKNVSYKLSGVDGYNSYSTRTMQSQNFINEINQLNYLKFNEKPWILDSSNNISLVDVGPSSPKIQVEKITVTPKEYELKVGETKTLTVQITPENATDKSVTWKSSNTQVATVSDNGTVSAKSVGTATITCTAKDGSGKSASCELTVIPQDVLVTSIQLNKTSDELEVGNTTQLSATVYPSNATNKTVTWTSSNSSVATVSTSGLVTAKGAGTATITCSANDSGNAKATCTINVKAKEYIEHNGIRYKVLLGNTLSVTYLSSGKYSGNITIPASIISDGINYKVVEIGRSAFDNCKDLTSITLPNSIIAIETWAFAECSSLTSITLPNSLTKLGGAAFYGTNLSSILIPSSVREIESRPFGNCKNLSEIKVENNSQYYCTVDGILFNIAKETLIQYPAGKNTSKYSIPSTVTEIGFGAFEGSVHLTSISIPNSVTTIGSYAFSKSSLLSVLIPRMVKEIGDNAFHNCSKLTEINVVSFNSNYSSNEGVLFNKEKNKIIQFPAGKIDTEYIIPSTVTEIGSSAFVDCNNLNSVIIPNSVKIIGTTAFNRCSNIISFIIPQSVEKIGYCAFAFCSGLKTIWIDNSTPPFTYYYLFSGLNNENDEYYKNINLLVPSEAINTYRSHEVWGKFKIIEGVPENSLHSLGEALEKAAALANKEYSEPYVVDFEPVVTFVGGASNHIAHDGKYSIIYKGDLGLQPGQTVKKGWFAKLYNYNGVLELVPTEDIEIAGGNIGAVPEPVIIKNANEINSSVLSAVVYIDNAVFTNDTPSGRSTFTGKIGNQDVVFYNNYAVSSQPAGTYGLRATIGCYNGFQVQPIEFFPANSVESVVIDNGPAVYYNMQGLRVETPESGQLYIRLQNGKAEKVWIK